MRRRFMMSGNATNVIRYTSTDREIIVPNKINFGAPLAFNKYGKMTFFSDVKYIGHFAFYGCTSLESIEIPNSVTGIYDSAFYDCTSLESIEIPNSVTFIGFSAFYGCTSLANVYCKPTTPPNIINDSFFNNASNRKIYVPRTSLNAYKTARVWRDYADSIEPYDY